MGFAGRLLRGSVVSVCVSMVCWGAISTNRHSLILDVSFASTYKISNVRNNIGKQLTEKVITIAPGTNIQQLVNRHSGDTTFVIKKGTHRLQQIVPKNGNTFLGEKGAILSGARVLTDFLKEGKYWVVTGQTQQGQVHGKCQKQPNGNEPTSCRYPEDLFRDNILLTQVTNLSELTSDKWFFDYNHDKIYLANNPVGHIIETSVTRLAFEGMANNVTIRGLIVEKYANPAQHGAIHAKLGKDWIVEGSEVRLNHGVGIRSGEHIQILHSHIHHNGQLGIGGSGDNILIQNNEISHNNTHDFKREWEAGGTKFVKTQNLIVRENFVHHNRGPGLWTDIDNINTLYERNRVEDNERAGIFHEISYAAIIRDNVVKRNGLGFSTWLWGAGILIAGSSDTEVYGNTVMNNADGIGAIQQKRGVGKFGLYIVKNLSVHNNIVSMTQGGTGMVQDMKDSLCFTEQNNHFKDNTYHLQGKQKKYFFWMNAYQSHKSWQSYGHDQNGNFSWSIQAK